MERENHKGWNDIGQVIGPTPLPIVVPLQLYELLNGAHTHKHTHNDVSFSHQDSAVSKSLVWPGDKPGLGSVTTSKIHMKTKLL